MNALLYTSEGQATFNKAVQYGQAYFDTLNNYQKALLQEFAQHQLEGAQRTALSLLEKNPNYDYPTDCEGVERGQYWLDRVTAYRPAMTVLELFAAHKAAPVPIDKLVEATHKRPLPEIALYLIYSNRSLTRQEAKEIALAEGYSSETSGDALYNNFCKYSKYTNRTGFDYAGAEKKGQNMIQRITNVLPRLTGNQKECAEKEIIAIDKYIS